MLWQFLCVFLPQLFQLWRWLRTQCTKQLAIELSCSALLRETQLRKQVKHIGPARVYHFHQLLTSLLLSDVFQYHLSLIYVFLLHLAIKVGKLWSTKNKDQHVSLYSPKSTFLKDHILVLRRCSALKFLHILQNDLGLLAWMGCFQTFSQRGVSLVYKY